MSVTFDVTAEVRSDTGKGASRRLRRNGRIPAVIYGAGKEPQSLTMDHDTILHNLENEAFYSHILNISIDGKSEKAVLKDLQRHPYKPLITHLDLQRVSDREALRMHVPLHFLGEDVAPGVKQGGGIVSHLVNDVEITCLPKDLPEYIEADLSGLELGGTLHLSDLTLPAGVSLTELAHGPEHDLPVASIHAPRGGGEAADAAPSDEEGESGEGGE